MNAKPWNLDALERDLFATRPEEETASEREQRYAEVVSWYEDPEPFEMQVLKRAEAKRIETKHVRRGNAYLRSLGERFEEGGLQLDVFGDEDWRLLPISIEWGDKSYRVLLGSAEAADLDRWSRSEEQRANRDHAVRLRTASAARALSEAMLESGINLSAFVDMHRAEVS